MRWFPILVVCPLAMAHVVSLSSAELKVNGLRGEYELRMPAYEVQHVANPQTALLENVSFRDAKRVSGDCAVEPGTYICRATFEFAHPVPDKLDAHVTLYNVTVPNHVHLLNATQGNHGDQVVFDQRVTDVEIRFRPPSAMEKAVRDATAGMARLGRSFSGVVFLLALALAADSWGGYLALFLAGEWASLAIAPLLPLSFSSAFLESAMALTGAFLAIDLIALPGARLRGPMFPLFGVIHGLYFAAFPAGYLAGANLLQIVFVIGFGWLASKLHGRARTGALGLTVIMSIGWFVKLLVYGG